MKLKKKRKRSKICRHPKNEIAKIYGTFESYYDEYHSITWCQKCGKTL